MATHKTIDEVREKASQVEMKFHGRHKVSRAGAYEDADPVPVAPPLGYQKRQPHLWEQMRDAQRLLAAEALEETLEDSDDFDVDDEGDRLPGTRWENDRDPSLKELVKDGQASLAAKRRAAEEQADRDEEAAQEVVRPGNTQNPPQKRKKPPAGEE